MSRVSSAVRISPLCVDDGREVFLADVTNNDGTILQLAVKAWEPDRLAAAQQQVRTASAFLLLLV